MNHLKVRINEYSKSLVHVKTHEWGKQVPKHTFISYVENDTCFIQKRNKERNTRYSGV